MIYYFSKQQWKNLWNLTDECNDLQLYVHRRESFMQRFPNLTYMEFATINENRWGSISGNEKDINWFILQL